MCSPLDTTSCGCEPVWDLAVWQLKGQGRERRMKAGRVARSLKVGTRMSVAFSFAGVILIAGHSEVGLAVICSAAMRIKSLVLAISFVADCSTRRDAADIPASVLTRDATCLLLIRCKDFWRCQQQWPAWSQQWRHWWARRLRQWLSRPHGRPAVGGEAQANQLC